MIGTMILEVRRRDTTWRRVVTLPELPAAGDVVVFGRGEDVLTLRCSGRAWDLAGLPEVSAIAFLRPIVLDDPDKVWPKLEPLLDKHLERVSESTEDEEPKPTREPPTGPVV